MEYFLVDVFSSRPYSGNGLPVFVDPGPLTASQMLAITRELRFFEAIFVFRTEDPRKVRARVFDLFEELPFAGHPLLGAAAVLHRLAAGGERETWHFGLPAKTVAIATERTPAGCFGWLDQGRPEFLGTVADRQPYAAAFGLTAADLHPDLPLEVVSTGLRYLILPLRPGILGKARPVVDLTALLAGVCAAYAVLLDEEGLEIRHWNNDGVLEDVATGSAAGTIGAYRRKHGLAAAGEPFVLQQGRFLGRPSELRVVAEGDSVATGNIRVGGDVVFVGRGVLDVVPADPDEDRRGLAAP